MNRWSELAIPSISLGLSCITLGVYLGGIEMAILLLWVAASIGMLADYVVNCIKYKL